MELNLTGKTALIAASSQGLGFAIAKQTCKRRGQCHDYWPQ